MSTLFTLLGLYENIFQIPKKGVHVLYKFKLFLGLVITYLSLLSSTAQAGDAKLATTANSSLEVNVLWPFLPGGISEFRYLKPIYNTSERSNVGSLVLGLYSDFASQIVRDSEYGKVSLYALKLGYRQYFYDGWHIELTTNLGRRKEVDRPQATDKNIEGFSARLWTLAGYQYDISKLFYTNFRAGIGNHLYRSDSYAETEKKTVIGFDINLGVNF
ncbi:MAG: hypothetical protein ACK4VO_09795 [Pseudobdellovibrio sp.]